MDYLEDFPNNVSNAITKFISDFKLDNPNFFGVNIVIRDDVFSILGKKAIVVFFPLEQEENDGFHVKRTVNGEPSDFVFINTAKSVEKQVFTAAHELGHRLEIEKYIIDICPDFDIEKYKENVVNRFAAMLLVPEDEFKKSVSAKLVELKNDAGVNLLNSTIVIPFQDVFRLIVYLMDYFYVPFKTIVYRLSETGIVSKEVREQILDNYSDVLLEECIRDGKYLKLNKPNLKKSIAGYAELLERAEKMESLPTQKIEKIRDQFDIPRIETDDQLKLTLSIEE